MNMPLPGDSIIHPGFQAAWQPTITATMRSTVRVIRLADQQGTRDPIAGRTTFAVPYVAYEGPARVQSRGAGTASDVGNRRVTLGSYLVAVPVDALVQVEDLIEVIECPGDRALEGLTLKCVDLPHADISWQRNLGCDLHQPSPRR